MHAHSWQIHPSKGKKVHFLKSCLQIHVLWRSGQMYLEGYLAPVSRSFSVACETWIRCSGTDGEFHKAVSIFGLPLTSKQKQDLRAEKEAYWLCFDGKGCQACHLWPVTCKANDLRPVWAWPPWLDILPRVKVWLLKGASTLDDDLG